MRALLLVHVVMQLVALRTARSPRFFRSTAKAIRVDIVSISAGSSGGSTSCYAANGNSWGGLRVAKASSLENAYLRQEGKMRALR